MVAEAESQGMRPGGSLGARKGHALKAEPGCEEATVCLKGTTRLPVPPWRRRFADTGAGIRR